MNTNQFIAMNRLLSAQFSLILCSNETHKPKWRGESLLTLSFYAVSTNIEILLVEILFYLGRIWFLKINKWQIPIHPIVNGEIYDTVNIKFRSLHHPR